MIDVLNLIQHFYDHQEGDYRCYHINCAYLYIPSRINHDHRYQNEYKIDSADLK